MLFVNGSKSVLLSECIDMVLDPDPYSENEFTIEQAAVYWSGFAVIGCDDLKAMLFYESIFNILYNAYEDREIVLCSLAVYDGWADSSAKMIAVSGMQYVFKRCKVTRSSLINFARIVDECPLFLFSNGNQKESDAKNDGAEGGKREENKIIKEKEWESVIADANDVISKTPVSYHLYGGNYNCSNIGKKLFIDKYSSVVGREESSVIRKLRDYRHKLISKSKDKK